MGFQFNGSAVNITGAVKTSAIYVPSDAYTLSIDTASYDSGIQATNTAYHLLKEWTLYTPNSGTGYYRISFTGKRSSTNGTVHMKIYKNGVAVGTERLLTTSDVVYTEDLVFEAGDFVQVYINNTNGTYGGSGYCKSMSILGETISGDDSLLTLL